MTIICVVIRSSHPNITKSITNLFDLLGLLSVCYFINEKLVDGVLLFFLTVSQRNNVEILEKGF